MGILIPVIILGSLGALFGLWLGFVQKLFLIKKDPRTESVFSLLPGSNCGACGQAGCYGLAEALAEGDIKTITCPVIHEKEREGIAELLGIKVSAQEKEIATLLCGGGVKCKDNFQYHGIKNCNMASLVMNGPKACLFGCIGLGSCAEICPFDAIKMGKDNLPHIDADKCTGCGKCIKICPKDVLVIAPLNSKHHIMCNSQDRGPDVMKFCKVGCIGCAKCVKVCPVEAITLDNNLAKIDYSKCTNCTACIEACPTKAIAKR